MSQTTVTLFAALIGVFGALAGLVVGRLLRSVGRLWCEPSEWKLSFIGQFNEYGETNEIDPNEEQADTAHYSVTLDLFNGKEIPVGLRDVSVVFSHDGGELIDHPTDTANTSRVVNPITGSMDVYTTLAVLNLSPRQWVHLELYGNLGDVEAMKGWRKAELVGQRQKRGLFEGKTYRKTIATR